MFFPLVVVSLARRPGVGGEKLVNLVVVCLRSFVDVPSIELTKELGSDSNPSLPGGRSYVAKRRTGETAAVSGRREERGKREEGEEEREERGDGE